MTLLSRWVGLASLFVALVTLGQATETAPAIVPLGDNTFSVTVSATHKFTRNTDKLKEQAMAAATTYCSQLGKQLKFVSVTENKSMYLVGGMASTTLTFKALDLTDPALSASSPAAATGTVDKTTAPNTNESLYADLLRLDDLRKKGILTEEEFKAEKKKVLERSK